MRLIKIFICVSFAVLSFSSCDTFRTSQAVMDVAGPKNIARYVWKKMDANGDFSISIYDTANFGKIIFWNNDNDVINNVTFDGDKAPAGWFYANVGVGTPSLPIGWFVDYEDGKTLTLWSEESLGGKFRVTYTMTKNYNASKINLETVYYTQHGTFKEVLELESISGNNE